jgi:putative flippase GtrA
MDDPSPSPSPQGEGEICLTFDRRGPQGEKVELATVARFLRFALVGGVGFLVDAGLLIVLHYRLGLDPFSGRAASIIVAALTTWRLNRALTFGASPRSATVEGMRYGLVAGAAAGLNYAVYTAALLVLPDLPPVAAAILATLVAMGFSYAGYSRFVFGAERSAVAGPPSSQSR